MKILNFVAYVSAFIATWLVVSRLTGQAAFHTSDFVAMTTAAVGACVGTRWATRRLRRAPSAGMQASD